jgi:hypothetical protein
LSSKTIRKYFDRLNEHQTENVVFYKNKKKLKKLTVNITMDTTYFGRKFGVLVIRGKSILGTHNLYRVFLKNETRAYYLNGLRSLMDRYTFKSITVDGVGGLIKAINKVFPGVPVQLCQFHQILMIKKYIGMKPKTDCGRELKWLVQNIKNLGRDEFVRKLKYLVFDHAKFLQERNYKDEYCHQDLRSAIKSVQDHIPNLFTYESYPGQGIPKTTNSSEGSFGAFKGKIALHRGLNQRHKKQMIDKFLDVLD